jgi:hypothetical protein
MKITKSTLKRLIKEEMDKMERTRQGQRLAKKLSLELKQLLKPYTEQREEGGQIRYTIKDFRKVLQNPAKLEKFDQQIRDLPTMQYIYETRAFWNADKRTRDELLIATIAQDYVDKLLATDEDLYAYHDPADDPRPAFKYTRTFLKTHIPP